MTSYAIDQAVWDFGQSLEVAMGKAEEKGKNHKDKQARRQEVLTRWLTPGSGGQKRYRQPGSDGASKRM